MRIDPSDPSRSTGPVAPQTMGHGSNNTKTTSREAFEKSVAPNLQLAQKPHDWDITSDQNRPPKPDAMRRALL